MNLQITGIGLALAMALVSTTPALAETSTSSTPPRARKAKAPKGPKVPPHHSQGETRKERDQRLLRECRGKPNAGACEGYAS